MALGMPRSFSWNVDSDKADATLQPPGCKYGHLGQLVGWPHDVGWLPQASAPCDSNCHLLPGLPSPACPRDDWPQSGHPSLGPRHLVLSQDGPRLLLWLSQDIILLIL